MSMRILQATNKEDNLILTTPSTEIENPGDAESKAAFTALFQATVANKCLGLALPQLGINKRIIAITRNSGKDILVMTNPKIKAAKGLIKFKEGCLSLPGFNVNVERAKEILVEYVDFRGNMHTLEFKDTEAVCIQHEIDHLDGILMTKHGMPYKRR